MASAKFNEDEFQKYDDPDYYKVSGDCDDPRYYDDPCDDDFDDIHDVYGHRDYTMIDPIDMDAIGDFSDIYVPLSPPLSADFYDRQREQERLQKEHDALASKLIDHLNVQMKQIVVETIIKYNLGTSQCKDEISAPVIEKTRDNLDYYWEALRKDKEARDLRQPTKYYKPLPPLQRIAISPDSSRVATHREEQVPDKVDSETKLAILARMAALSVEDDDDETPDFSYREQTTSTRYKKTQ